MAQICIAHSWYSFILKNFNKNYKIVLVQTLCISWYNTAGNIDF